MQKTELRNYTRDELEAIVKKSGGNKADSFSLFECLYRQEIKDFKDIKGINLKVVFTGIFALGALVAGLCGLMGAPLMGINLQVGWDALLLAMIVVIVGGAG